MVNLFATPLYCKPLPGLVDIIVGYDCNLFCDYCTISTAMRARALTANQIGLAMRDARAQGFDAVAFTGGEPTIRPDLLGLVRFATKLGYRDIKVQSNGLLLGSSANVDRLLKAGVTRVHISIHAHRREHYEATVAREGTYDAMVASLKCLVQAPVELVVDIIVKRDTYEQLPAALTWLVELGVCKADLWFVSLTDNNAGNIDSMPPMTAVLPAVAQARQVARARGMRLRSLHIPRCILGELADLAWDPAAGRVRVVTPDAIFDLCDSRLTGGQHVPACEGCEARGSCGGLRDDYMRLFGDVEVARARGREPTRTARSLKVY